MIRKTETIMSQFRKTWMGLSVVVFGLMILVCSVWAAPAAPESQATDGIEIRYLAAGKKVIPVVCDIGDWRIVDIKLPDLVVTNNGKSAITIDKVDVLGKIEETSGVSIQISGKELSDAIRNTASMLNTNRPPLFSLQISFGNIVLPEGVVSENRTVSVGQSVLLPLSKITYLHYVGHSKIDSLHVVIAIKDCGEGGEMKRLTFPIRLTHYENKGKYIFPPKRESAYGIYSFELYPSPGGRVSGIWHGCCWCRPKWCCELYGNIHTEPEEADGLRHMGERGHGDGRWCRCGDRGQIPRGSDE